MAKCEFCDMSLKSDLDVSKHLVSQTHRDNVRKAIDVHPLEKSNLKDTPSNIVKVFESLKLRTVKDVRDLADKGYFRIPENSPGILSVADRLVHVFLKCIAEYRTRSLPPQARKIVMDSFEKVKEEPAVSRPPIQPPKEKGPQQGQQTQQAESGPSVQQQQPPANPPTTRPEPVPTGSPPLKRRPLNDPRPAPLYTPGVNTGSAAQVRPAGPPNRTASESNSSTNMPANSVSARQRTQTIRQNTPKSLPTSAGSVLTSTGSVGPRVPGQGPNPRVAAPTQRATNAAAASIRPPTTRTPAPMQRPQVTRPDAPRSANTRPALIQVPTTRPILNRPAPMPTVRPPRPPSNLPPPDQMPMAGAIFMPRRPIDDDSPPQPRLDSTYQPRLAKIKVEPKDST